MRPRCRLLLTVVVLVLVLVAVLAVRGGACRPSPPDDEPVPADCKPGDNTCHGVVGVSSETGS